MENYDGYCNFANGILLVSTFMWAPTAALIASGVALVTGLPAYYFFDKKNRTAADGN